MAWVTKLEGPKRGTRYKVHWRDPAGHHRSVTLPTRKAADDRRRRIEIELSTGTWRDPADARVLLREHLARWLSGAEIRDSTRDGYERAARRAVEAFGDVPIGAIRPDDVRSWMSGLSRADVGARSVQEARKVLSLALGQAVRDGILPENPCRWTSPPRSVRRELRIPTPGQVEAIADAVAPAYRALVLLAAFGGLRFGELAGLQRRDVVLLERKVRVERQVVETSRGVRVAELKTKASRRSVAIPASVATELAHRLEDVDADPEAHVFTTSPGGALLRHRNFRPRVWLPALRSAGVQGVRFHDLRHHAVAIAIAAGAHEKAIQTRMGHASSRTTLDVYGHLFPSLDEELAQRLDVARAAARPAGTVVAFPGT